MNILDGAVHSANPILGRVSILYSLHFLLNHYKRNKDVFEIIGPDKS